MYIVSWPNLITIARILLIGPFVVALLHLHDADVARLARWSAMGIYALMSISDALDGYLARRMKQESSLGRFLDPVADKLLILCSVVLLAYGGTHVPGMQVPVWVVVIAIWKDLVVVIGFVVVYLITSKVYIVPRFWGKATTGTQLVMVIAILLSPDLPGMIHRLPVFLWWTASILAGLATIDYCRAGLQYLDRYEKEVEAARVEPDRPAKGGD
jgi:CDP-diacylglycerol--glycerol-3-phosphate 3-phosphatidyltransferase